MKAKTHLRWCILSLIFLATVICYMDRQVISILMPVISDKDHYDLTKSTQAWIFNAYLFAYTVGPSIMGWLMDKWGSRRGYAVSMAFWSAAGVLTALAVAMGTGLTRLFGIALAPVVVGLMVCRFVLGIGESANWPAAIKTISEWFPTRERSLAVGWFNSGSSVGAAIAPGLCTYILIRYGWQWAFVSVGSIGFLWIFAWLAYYRPLAQHPRVTEEERSYIQSGQEQTTAKAKRVRWGELLRVPQVRGVVMTRFFMDQIWWFYSTWLPTFLKDDRGLDVKTGWIPLTVAFVASDLGNLFGGWASSALIKRGYSMNAARKIVMTPCAAVMMVGLAVPFIPKVWNVAISPNAIVIALISLVTFSYQSWSVNMLTIPADVLPAEVVGSAAGLSHMGAGLGGIVAMYLTGYLADKTGSFSAIVWVMGAMPVIGVTFLYLVIGKIVPYRREAANVANA